MKHWGDKIYLRKMRAQFSSTQFWQRVAVVCVLISVFFVVARIVVNFVGSYANTDFFTLWLAGRMSLHGQDVYSQNQWLAERRFYGSTWMLDPVFPYPIPFALFLAPLGVLPLKTAFITWTFATEILLTISVVLLMVPWNEQKIPLFGVLIIGLFLFRPVLLSLINGQTAILSLFFLCFAVFLWGKQRWFWGGAIISLLNLKPSYGVLILIFVAIWLFSEKRWAALSGMVLGSLALGGIGFLQNPHWVSLFMHIGQRKLSETFGLHPTVWGVVDLACGRVNACVYVFGGGLTIFLVALYLFLLYTWRHDQLDPMELAALVIPLSLLMSAYSWAYDQLLLIGTIVFCVQRFARCHKFLPYLFPLLIDFFSLLLLAWASFHGIDVWSALLPAVLVVITLWLLVNRRNKPVVASAGI